jgi:two-component system phosphate regulon response regulator OmpR
MGGSHEHLFIRYASMSHAPQPGIDAPILVVEDDPTLRRIIREVLEDEGFTVESTPNGSEAVRLARHRKPALVVLDMVLPGANGSVVAGAIREAHGAAPPILLISADAGARRKARHVGAFAFLAKPLELDELIAAVRQGLQEGRSPGEEAHPRV